jgi:hypothetical protein
MLDPALSGWVLEALSRGAVRWSACKLRLGGVSLTAAGGARQLPRASDARNNRGRDLWPPDHISTFALKRGFRDGPGALISEGAG